MTKGGRHDEGGAGMTKRGRYDEGGRHDETDSRTLTEHQCVDLLVGRKPPQDLFGEFQVTIDFDLEHTARSGHEFDVVSAKRNQSVPRTESLRFIISLHAIFDTDLHSQHSV